MELLLVVGVLAVVATAAVPVFFTSSKDAVDEAKKSGFITAYNNTLTGAHLLLASYVAKGIELGSSMDLTELKKFVPLSARTFKNLAGTTYTFGARLQIDEEEKIVAFYKEGTDEPKYEDRKKDVVIKNKIEYLNDNVMDYGIVWNPNDVNCGLEKRWYHIKDYSRNKKTEF